jgi:hypothetical protein
MKLRNTQTVACTAGTLIARPSAIIMATPVSIFWSGRCLVGYRLPPPICLAHHIAKPSCNQTYSQQRASLVDIAAVVAK